MGTGSAAWSSPCIGAGRQTGVQRMERMERMELERMERMERMELSVHRSRQADGCPAHGAHGAHGAGAHGAHGAVCASEQAGRWVSSAWGSWSAWSWSAWSAWSAWSCPCIGAGRQMGVQRMGLMERMERMELSVHRSRQADGCPAHGAHGAHGAVRASEQAGRRVSSAWSAWSAWSWSAWSAWSCPCIGAGRQTGVQRCPQCNKRSHLRSPVPCAHAPLGCSAAHTRTRTHTTLKKAASSPQAQCSLKRAAAVIFTNWRDCSSLHRVHGTEGRVLSLPLPHVRACCCSDHHGLL